MEFLSNVFFPRERRTAPYATKNPPLTFYRTAVSATGATSRHSSEFFWCNAAKKVYLSVGLSLNSLVYVKFWSLKKQQLKYPVNNYFS